MTDSIRFTQIRNATVIVDCAGVRFLIDPMFAPKDAYPPLEIGVNPTLRWPVCDLPYPPDQFPEYDAIFFTHLHIDHADPLAFALLPKNLPVFTQDREDGTSLIAHGFRDVRVLEADGTEFRGIKMYKTQCLHGEFVPCKPVYDAIDMRPEAAGCVFRTPSGKTLYLVGDTVWCEFVDDAIERYKPDAVVLNAAAAGFVVGSTFHQIITGAADVIRMSKRLPNARVVASHMDCVPHATNMRKDVLAAARDSGLTERIAIPADGETITLC